MNDSEMTSGKRAKNNAQSSGRSPSKDSSQMRPGAITPSKASTSTF